MPAALDPETRRLRRLLAIAAEVGGQPGILRSEWARTTAGVDLKPGAFDQAINTHRRVGGPVRPTLAVSHEFMGLVPYLMRVEGRSLSSPDLVTAVSVLAGVCAVVELDDELDLLIFCLVEDDQEANRLRDEIRARVPTDRGVSKNLISRVNREPEIYTWEQLAVRQARRLQRGPSVRDARSDSAKHR